MQDIIGKPVLFFKPDCPFCFKVRLFLLEAGLLGNVDLREALNPSDQDAFRKELEPHLEKVSFPAARFASDDYLAESDDIIARLAAIFEVEPSSLPVFKAYLDGPFAHLLKLHGENVALRKQVS